MPGSSEAEGRHRLWFALIVAAFYGLSLFYGDRWSDVGIPVAFAVVYLPLLVRIGGRYLQTSWHIRRFVRSTRTLGGPARVEVLDRIEHMELRERVQQELQRHGEPGVNGLVHRFSFSPIDRRECTLAGWLSAALGTFGLILIVAGTPFRWIWAIVGPLAFMLAGAMWLRVGQLATTIEISPFALSEVTIQGRIRRVLFGQGLTLVDRPRRRRLELSVTGRPEFIALPYALVGLNDAVDLLLKFGGFENSAAD
jgi:hypothetical protein